MINATELLGGAGPFISDVTQWGQPVVAARGRISLKTASNLVSADSTAAFWTALDLQGAFSSVATNDVYATAVDITGSSGVVCCVIGSASGDAADNGFIRVTVDGTVREFSTTRAVGQRRLILGHYSNQTPATSSVTANTTHIQDMFDSPGFNVEDGFLVASESSQGNAYIQPVQQARNNGSILLRFNSSLKVEAKESNVQANAENNKFGVVYAID